MKNLFGLTLPELETELKSLPKFRVKQIAAHIYKHGMKTFDEMNDLPKSLRAEMSTRYEIKTAELLTQLDSADGLTTKFLLGLSDGAAVEIVLMRHDYGNSVCISSQVGCQMGCKFCASTLKGLQRNLTAAEMLGEILFADEYLRRFGKTLDSIVVMGTGEPLMNYDELMKMLRLLHEDYCLGMSYRRVTISTCGIVPAIKKLRDEKIPVTLSISLHAPDDKLRSALMPINSAFGIKSLLEAANDYAQTTGRRVTYEYILIGGVNDTEEHARRLAKILSGQLANVNLIPFNPVSERDFNPPTRNAVQKFFHFLNTHGIGATIRKEMGADVNAACGQLKANWQNQNH
ncbi:MAG: 23S rRNA (adenine(2503)-C(2))-methyltransferase RlmN [Selenomonadaceae bacterium]|nr:23S rRNA (adenine(2503)-C(2))-methyltransferase RlmN [Selenomonadaceae bacterium]